MLNLSRIYVIIITVFCIAFACGVQAQTSLNVWTDTDGHLWAENDYYKWDVTHGSSLIVKVGDTPTDWRSPLNQNYYLCLGRNTAGVGGTQGGGLQMSSLVIEDITNNGTIAEVALTGVFNNENRTIFLVLTFYANSGLIKMTGEISGVSSIPVPAGLRTFFTLVPGGDVSGSVDSYHYSGQSGGSTYPYNTWLRIPGSNFNTVGQTDYAYITKYDVAHQQGYAIITDYNNSTDFITDINYYRAQIFDTHHYANYSNMGLSCDASQPFTKYFYFYQTDPSTAYQPVEDMINSGVLDSDGSGGSGCDEVLYEEHFDTDVIASGEWDASDNSVSIDIDNGLLHIDADGGYDDFAEKTLPLNLPVTVETKMRLVSGGRNYTFPRFGFRWGPDWKNSTYLPGPGYGWYFIGEFTDIHTDAPTSENQWWIMKQVLRSDGGELWAKSDEDAEFNLITSRSWSIPGEPTGFYMIQNWDAVCDLDYVKICSNVDSEGDIEGTVFGPGGGSLGVPVDLVDSEGELFNSTITDDLGYYEFFGIPNGTYTVSIATPLGYLADSESQEVEVLGLIYEVNFNLTQLEIPLSQRGRGYWMHQVNALLSGKGNPHETYENMCQYMDLIRTHFNEHNLNAVNVFEVDLNTECDGNLDALRTTISPRSKATMIDKAKAHLTALLLNMVSGKIAQWAYISEDDATLSQAITYCNQLITTTMKQIMRWPKILPR